MKTFTSNILETDTQKRQGKPDRLPVILGLIAIAISGVLAAAISDYGALILLAVLALVFLVVVFVKPDYGLVIFIFITVTQVSNVAIKFYGAPSIARPLAALLMAVILLRIVLYGERLLNMSRFVPVLALYIFALFVSMLSAEDFVLSSDTFNGFFKDALGGVIIILLIQRPASFRQAAWAMIIAGIFMGSISVFQAVTDTYDNSYFGFGGWDTQTAGQQTRNRLTGPYANPNAYSQVMVVIFALSLERLWHEKRSLLRLAAGWGAFVTSLTIVLTYSRGGLLTFIATLGILFLQNRPRLFPLLLTIMVALGLTQLLPSDYALRVSTLQDLIPSQNNQITDQSFRGRLSENIAAWRMFTDDPFFGVGLGNFSVQYQEYSRQIGLDPRRVSRTPASLYLEVLSEQGMVGAIPFALLLYTIFTGLIFARVHFTFAGLTDHSRITMGLIAGFAGYMFAATVKNSAYSNVYWILVGLAISAYQVALYHSREKSELLGTRKAS